MAFDPISAVFGLVETGMDKFLPDAMSEKEKADVALKMKSFVATQVASENSDFRNFVLQYEGAAKDIPKSLVWLRSSIRPIITYLSCGAYGYGWLHPEAFTVEQMLLLKPVVLIVLSFWFGEKIITRTGLLDVMKK